MFDPKKFTTRTTFSTEENMFRGPVHGGKKLPKARKHQQLAGNVKLVGYADKKGCYSYILSDSDTVDVAFYLDTTPKELGEVDINNAVYETFDNVPGWGFGAMGKLKELLS